MVQAAGLRRFMDSAGLLRMTSPCCVAGLEQIVDSADHRPLGSDLVEAAKEERAEASGVFDLAEHRFDDLLSQAVAATPAGALEFCRHGGPCAILWAIVENRRHSLGCGPAWSR